MCVCRQVGLLTFFIHPNLAAHEHFLDVDAWFAVRLKIYIAHSTLKLIKPIKPVEDCSKCLVTMFPCVQPDTPPNFNQSASACLTQNTVDMHNRPLGLWRCVHWPASAPHCWNNPSLFSDANTPQCRRIHQPWRSTDWELLLQEHLGNSAAHDIQILEHFSPDAIFFFSSFLPGKKSYIATGCSI